MDLISMISRESKLNLDIRKRLREKSIHTDHQSSPSDRLRMIEFENEMLNLLSMSDYYLFRAISAYLEIKGRPSDQKGDRNLKVLRRFYRREIYRLQKAMNRTLPAGYHVYGLSLSDTWWRE